MWKDGSPNDEAIVDASAFGYPVRSLAEIPPGEYWVQALLHRYETFKRSDGHTVKLPMDRGEGQQWSRAPGNLYSVPAKDNHRSAKRSGIIKLTLNQVIPPIAPPKIRSTSNTSGCKASCFLTFGDGQCTSAPTSFCLRDSIRIRMLAIRSSFFTVTFLPTLAGSGRRLQIRTLKPEFSERFKFDGYNKIVQEEAYKFYQEWTGPNFPRMIIIEIQHANPYYDDSYAVNSVNLGPYGDAITYELVPYIEKQFRGLGQGWARFMYGGSTGGWEALAAQIFYPDEYNGAWGACPDPIDFRAYTVINIYQHKNAYYADNTWKKVPRPGKRNYLGELAATAEDANHMELALGTKSRSGGQFDIWEAVYSPVGADGYPKPIWNKLTGEIDHSVAEYWREHYDLGHILKRDWAKLGPSSRASYTSMLAKQTITS